MRTLHAIIGYGLPIYFRNALSSVLQLVPDPAVLVVDNASPDPSIAESLRELGKGHDVTVVRRSPPTAHGHPKWGTIAEAQAEVFTYAVEHGYDLLQVMHGDMQLVWWDERVLKQAMAPYDENPRCLNVVTGAWRRDASRLEEFEASGTPGVLRRRDFGLTDTGLFHLERWVRFGMRHHANETKTGHYYAELGFEVLTLPVPAVAQVPWPAVVRRGRQIGKEVHANNPLLLRPLSDDEIATMASSGRQHWLEDICIPWGWTCVTPMWVTDLDEIPQWISFRVEDLRSGRLPGLALRGVERSPRALMRALREVRPPVHVIAAVLARRLVQVVRIKLALRTRLAGRRAEPVVRERGAGLRSAAPRVGEVPVEVRQVRS